MSGAKEYLQVKFLKTLEPLGSLTIDKLEEIAKKSHIEELPPGRVVFRQGEKDSRSTYLLSGQLELQVTGNPRTETLKAKTVEARYPVAQEWPRPSTCRTKTNTVLLHIDSDLLEILLSDDPSGSYEVTEIGGQEDPESDWMLHFLQSPAFLNLPTDNIQRLLMTLEEVPSKAGQTVIKQGDSDEYYYIVKQGKCSVSRRPAPRAEEVRLAILGPGDGFGEEALITGGKRNATVTMKEDGILMRLNKTDFHKLLVEPMLTFIDHSSMMEKVRAGAALVDVRTNKEFTDNGIKGSINIPLSMLRVKARDLNRTREHIIYCNDGHLSSAAAFLLGQQSLQVSVLEGGLNSQQKPFSPAINPTPKSEAPISKDPIPTLSAATTVTPATATTTDPDYLARKKKAQEQARRASEAENVRKDAEAKTRHLRDEADALRTQAEQLASKTARAEAERRTAEEEINRIRQETLQERDQILASAKQSEQEVNRLKNEAETARKRAEEELARIRRESESVHEKQTELEAEFKRAEAEKQQAGRAAEVARIMAKQEAEQVKAEAEAIRQQAQQEAERIRQDMENARARMEAQEAAKHQAALEEARRKAEAALAESTKAAEEARRQAALEAEAIRKQALQDAEKLRLELEREKQQAAELTARSKAEQLLHQQALEEERRKALEEARQLAQAEAEQIRKQALEEAQRQAKLESKRQADMEVEALRKQTEEVQRKALETARFEAQKAAEAIRQEALAEANRLREEMAAARVLVENQTREAQVRVEEENARRVAEEEALARSAAEAAKRAAEEAERRRKEQLAARIREAQEQARRKAEEEARIAEEQAQRKAQEEARRQAEEMARHQEEAHRQAEEMARQQEQARIAAEEQAHIAEQEEIRQIQAKKMAESIKNRMQQNNSERQADEFIVEQGTGPKLAKAKLHVVKDKTILEGEEDIFIFKAPSEKPPSRAEAEELLRQAEEQFNEKARKELPSFEIEYKDDEPEQEPVVNTDSEFSDSVINELDNISANTRSVKREDDFAFQLPKNVADIRPAKSKRSLVALAASVVVMITISVIAITRPTYVDVNSIAGLQDEKNVEPQRGLAAMRTSSADNIQADIESRVKDEAEREYKLLLAKWRKMHNK